MAWLFSSVVSGGLYPAGIKREIYPIGVKNNIYPIGDKVNIYLTGYKMTLSAIFAKNPRRTAQQRFLVYFLAKSCTKNGKFHYVLSS
jgi:hypothetical protein